MKQLIVLFALLLPQVANAQTPQEMAAVLTVVHGEVMLRRANTEDWLPLQAGASGPVGLGDEVRTDATGRVFIEYGDAARVLVMPTTLYRIEQFSESGDGGLTIEAHAEGLTLHQTTAMEKIEDYVLVAGNARIGRPAESFAVWSDPGVPFTVTSAQGDVTVTANDQDFVVEAGSGLREGMAAATAFGPPYNEAMLRGATEGCEGVVRTEGGVDLVVRDGSHFDALLMGSFKTGDPVQVFGISEGRDRLRVHLLSGFGWVLARGVTQTCENLPVFPVPFAESNRTVLNVTDAEFEMLEPFYGRTVYDPFFYRFGR